MTDEAKKAFEAWATEQGFYMRRKNGDYTPLVADAEWHFTSGYEKGAAKVRADLQAKTHGETGSFPVTQETPDPPPDLMEADRLYGLIPPSFRDGAPDVRQRADGGFELMTLQGRGYAHLATFHFPHLAEFLAWLLVRFPSLLRAAADDPQWDCTDAAHPAWWRGHDWTSKVAAGMVSQWLKGEAQGGRMQDEWQEIRDGIASLRQQLAAATERAELAQANATLRGETINKLCNIAWQHVYGEGQTDWDYPLQAIRHICDYADEWKAKAEQGRRSARADVLREATRAIEKEILLYRQLDRDEEAMTLDVALDAVLRLIPQSPQDAPGDATPCPAGKMEQEGGVGAQDGAVESEVTE